MTTYNFAAGPAVLPQPVIQQIQEELPNFQGSGMSILEISHRSDLFLHVYAQAKQRLLDLMGLDPEVYDALFLQGGATLQFTMLPLNLATKHHKVAYVDSGHWSVRAIQEAQRIPGLTVDTIASSKAMHYTEIPEIPAIQENTYDYVHITTNNTIEGTAYHQLPQTDALLVADMSSNFLGQQYDYNAFDLIYAGAQKNLAPAGLTIVVFKKALLADHETGILPSMLDYKALAAKDSALNTPPVFQIYTAGLVLGWLADFGGVAAMNQHNEAKAKMLYDYLDQSKLFQNPVKPADRSLMNVPFVTGNPDMDKKVIGAATASELLNLKGHRSVGGLRASIYNAMPTQGVAALVTFLTKFEENL